MSSVKVFDDVRIIIQTIESIVKEDSVYLQKYKDRDYRLIGYSLGYTEKGNNYDKNLFAKS